MPQASSFLNRDLFLMIFIVILVAYFIIMEYINRTNVVETVTELEDTPTQPDPVPVIQPKQPKEPNPVRSYLPITNLFSSTVSTVSSSLFSSNTSSFSRGPPGLYNNLSTQSAPSTRYREPNIGVVMASRPSYTVSQYTSSPTQNVTQISKNTLQRISKILEQVFISLPESASYSIPKTLPCRLYISDKTYIVEKRKIYLAVWNTDKNRPYPDNTIIMAAIHELSHAICPDLDHTPTFYQIERDLLTTAQRIGVYRPRETVDPDYPCIDM